MAQRTAATVGTAGWFPKIFNTKLPCDPASPLQAHCVGTRAGPGTGEAHPRCQQHHSQESKSIDTTPGPEKDEQIKEMCTHTVGLTHLKEEGKPDTHGTALRETSSRKTMAIA